MGGESEMTVLDASGRVVHRHAARSGPTTDLDLSQLEAGPYLLLVTNDRGTSATRMIKE